MYWDYRRQNFCLNCGGPTGVCDDVVLGDGSKTAVLTKSILYVGDCADIVDYNALFQKSGN